MRGARKATKRGAKPASAKGAHARRAGQPRIRVAAAAGVTHVTGGDGNVFADLGFPAHEAKNLKLRSDLMSALERIVEGMTQVEAAALLGVTQPRISELKRGHIGRFTIDALVNMLTHAGGDARVVIKAPARSVA